MLRSADEGLCYLFGCELCDASRLSGMFPDKLILGMELRDKVTEFVKLRIGEANSALEFVQVAVCVNRTDVLHLGIEQRP